MCQCHQFCNRKPIDGRKVPKRHVLFERFLRFFQDLVFACLIFPDLIILALYKSFVWECVRLINWFDEILAQQVILLFFMCFHQKKIYSLTVKFFLRINIHRSLFKGCLWNFPVISFWQKCPTALQVKFLAVPLLV